MLKEKVNKRKMRKEREREKPIFLSEEHGEGKVHPNMS